MDADKYAEQMKWRQNIDESMERQRREAEEELNKLTFTPILETKALGGEGDGKGGKEGDKAEVKKVTGHVAELSNSYAERQMKARKEKSNNKSNNWRPTRAKRSPNANSSLLIGNALSSSSHHATLSSSTMGGGNKSSLSPPPLNLQPLSMGESNSSSPFRQHLPLNEEDIGNVSPKDLTYEESLIDMLEKERKEWHVERVKLIHCIYLQQMELTERAVAAQEKASEIAKEFGKAIMTFEQRLDTIESNVEKEIRAVKDIAENLLRTATTSNDLMTLQQQRHNNSSERSV